MKEQTGMKKLLEERKRGKRFCLDQFNKHNQLNGVCYYLYDKGLKDAVDQHYIIKLYVLHMQWELPQDKHILEACVQIQKDFKSFIQWFHKQQAKYEKAASIADFKPF